MRKAVEHESKTRGCLIWLAAILGLILLMTAIGVGLVLHKARQLRNEYTDTTPLQVPVVTPSPQRARELAREYDTMKGAIKEGKQETFVLSADDLNQMLAAVDDADPLRGRVLFAIEDDRLKATASVPLDMIPGFQGRFLNGNFDLDLRCENGVLEIYAHQVTVNGKPFPPALMSQLRSRNLAQELYKNPEAVDKLKNIESLKIENGKLVFTTKAR